MTAYLLAMTRLTAYLWWPLAALYGVLIVYVILGGWFRKSNRAPVRLLLILILPTLLFVALWFCGLWIWPILLWIQWGDDSPYDDYGKWIAGTVALLTALAVVGRLTFGWANQRFRRVSCVGTAVLTLLISAMYTQEFTSRILGWSARGAAENYLGKRHYHNHPFVVPGAPRRIVEDNVATQSDDPRQVRRFILYYGNSPIQYVNVAPYGWFWWTLASSGPVDAIFDLDWSADHWDTQQKEATERLSAIIRDYPNSEAARRASELLEQLQMHGSAGVPRLRVEMMQRVREEALRRRAAQNRER